MTMIVCTKRQVICLALTLPTCIYLVLMFAAIGQVCLKTDPEELHFKEEYIKLLDFLQGRSLAHQSQPGDPSRQDVTGARRAMGSKVYNVTSSLLTSKTSTHIVPDTPRTALLYNCSTISLMKIRSKIGHGVSKQAFIADNHGTQVAIKMVTRHIHEVRKCLDQLKRSHLDDRHLSHNNELGSLGFSKPEHVNSNSAIGETKNVYRNLDAKEEKISKQISSDSIQLSKLSTEQRAGSLKERQRCYTAPTARLMKEILLSQQLQHHNLARLLGYCVRSEESDSTDISEHGVISVYELGSRFVLDNLQILPWQTRLRHATEMADLLDYLQNSPLGSLVVADLKEGHLVMINDSLKLIDLDDVNNLEPNCDGREHQCPYNIRCDKALCEGFNARENLKNMNGLVLKRLLFPLTFPEQVVADIGQLNAKLDSLELTAAELHRKLVQIQTFLSKSEML